MPQIERALVRTVPWLLAGLVAALPLLLIESPDKPLIWFLLQLAALVLFGFGLSLALIPLADASWFVGMGWSIRIRLIASGIAIVVLVTGTVGLVAMATSAAMRYDISLQYLQVLSAVDIAWAGTALMVGAYRAWGRRAAVGAGVILGVFCIWSIWNYLNTVGFGPEGQWVVSGAEMMRLVIPYDMAAATVAIAVFLYGVVRTSGETAQATDQS